MSEENTNSANDHLSNFIKNNEHKPEQPIITNIEQFGSNIKQKVEYIETKADSLWIDVPLEELPYGKFYPIGTHIFIRPATTQEIEAFAVVNDKNPFDVQLKLNEILSACTKISFIDGSYGTYKDIQSGDRDTLSIVIAKATAKNGNKIQKKVICDCDVTKEGINVEMIPANYIYKTESEDVAPWFNKDKRVYEFELENGIKIALAPPSIGLTESINEYVFYKSAQSEGKIMPNLTFMQCIPYIKAGLGIKSLSIEQLEQEEYAFKKMNEELFMFIYDAIDLMGFGVEELKTKCTKCRKELKTPFSFPGGARALFVVPNAFKKFIRQRV